MKRFPYLKAEVNCESIEMRDEGQKKESRQDIRPKKESFTPLTEGPRSRIMKGAIAHPSGKQHKRNLSARGHLPERGKMEE